jgi:hypothetical protein
MLQRTIRAKSNGRWLRDAKVRGHLDKDMRMTNRDGGKGDVRRPLVIPEEQFNANWDAIFKPNPLADKVVKQIEESIKNESK